MNNSAYMAMAFIAGLAFGTLFFGGLWLTVRKAVASKNTALVLLTSSMLRTGIVLAGFYYVANGNWQRLLICVFGFIAARFIVLSLTRTFDKKQAQLNKTAQP